MEIGNGKHVLMRTGNFAESLGVFGMNMGHGHGDDQATGMDMGIRWKTDQRVGEVEETF